MLFLLELWFKIGQKEKLQQTVFVYYSFLFGEWRFLVGKNT
jgi:hypothetical protein